METSEKIIDMLVELAKEVSEQRGTLQRVERGLYGEQGNSSPGIIERVKDLEVVAKDYEDNKIRLKAIRWAIGILFAAGTTLYGWIIYLIDQWQEYVQKALSK